MAKCLSCGHQAEGNPKFCPECGGKFGATPSGRGESLVGRTLSAKYRLVSELGKGGMGTVYLAEHTGLKKRIALKVLHPDLQVSEESMQRFQREGIAAGQLGHAGAIQIFDFDKDESGLLYLAMEFVEGVDLKTLVRREGALDPARAVAITRQVLEVLAEAHRQGIVHRDLKPDNIMVLPGEGVDRVKVLDFGLSKLVDTPLDSSLMTQTGRIMGTPLYMSPEQCSGLEVDSRSDLYAVGLILHELISGRPTFSGDTIPEILVKHTSSPPPSLAEVRPGVKLPAGLEEVIDGALEKDRSERFQTADEMLEALDDVRLDQLQKPRRRRRRRRDGGFPWVPIVAGATALGLAGLVGFLLLGAGDDVPPGTFLSQLPVERLDAEQARYVRHLREAREARAEGSLDVALSAAEDALALGCRDAEALLVRARVLRARGERELAAADLEQALAERPGYADARAELGWLALDAGQVSAAATTFTEALAADADCASALAGEGEVLLRQGDREGARTRFRAAVERNPDRVEAHLALGRMALDEGDAQGALDAFVAVRRRAPGDWRGHAGQAEAYLALGREEDAERGLTEALRRDPRATRARGLLAGLLLGQGRGREAIELLRSAAPADDALGALLGAALAVDDQADRALEALTAAAGHLPQGTGELLLGQLELEEGSAERALEFLTRALEQLEDDEPRALALQARGLAALRLERQEEARVDLAAALELAPEDLYTLLTLGWVEMDWGDPARARELLQRYRDLGGGDDRVSGWLQRLRGR